MSTARKLEELEVWVLACELRDEVARIVGAGPAGRDFEFRGQILQSSRSAPANAAEGYGHYKPRQFARCLRIARASLMETKNHIYAGSRMYFSAEDTHMLLTLTNRALGATSRLIRYLESCPPDRD